MFSLISILTKICIVHGVFSSDLDFQELLNEVKRAKSLSSNYSLPKNNKQLLETSDATVYDFGTFDFIIVGSGAAGCVVANRLSEIPSWKVLLLEAGGRDDDVTDITGLNGLFATSDKNWGYNTTSSSTLCQGMKDHTCSYPRGKVRGGTTTINECIYARGHPEDYDLWAKLGNTGWSFEEVLPYFKKSEHADFPNQDAESAGTNGYLHVNYTPSTPGLEETLTKAYDEIGLKRLNDYNSRKQIGISKAQVMINFNKRESSARAFLDPIIDRQNLQVSLHSFVTKVLVNNSSKKAYGVYFIKDGKAFTATTKKEIIMSAGVINTPQILMLSGIGPKNHLKELNIPLIKNLPVGKNMGDNQWFSQVTFRSSKTLYNYSLEQNLKRYLKGLKPFASRIEMINFINLENKTESRADLEYYILVLGGESTFPGSSSNLDKIYSNKIKIDPVHDISFRLGLLHPKTRSEITLKSNSPLDFPNILASGLSDKSDLETLYKGIQYALALNRTQAFQEYGLSLYLPAIPPCDQKISKFTKKWWYCALRTFTSQGSHGVGTAKMGNESKTSVINSKLQVHGISCLRVIDGSAIPETISGHTTAPIIMVAEKGSDIIKRDYNKIK